MVPQKKSRIYYVDMHKGLEEQNNTDKKKYTIHMHI